MEFKTCIDCHQEKGFEQFNKSKTNKFGLAPFCRLCQSVRSKVWRENNVEKKKTAEEFLQYLIVKPL